MSTKPRKAQYKIKKPKKAIIGGGATEGGKPQKPEQYKETLLENGYRIRKRLQSKANRPARLFG